MTIDSLGFGLYDSKQTGRTSLLEFLLMYLETSLGKLPVGATLELVEGFCIPASVYRNTNLFSPRRLALEACDLE